MVAVDQLVDLIQQRKALQYSSDTDHLMPQEQKIN